MRLAEPAPPAPRARCDRADQPPSHERPRGERTSGERTSGQPEVDRRIDCRLALGLGLLVGLVALRYGLLGPRLLIDDWRHLAYREFDGVLGTGGGPKLERRPGSWAVYTALFGGLGPRPLALFAVQTALNAAVAASLFLVGRRYLPRHLAFAVAAVWVLLPNTSALSYWPSVTNGVVALLLLVLGVGLLDAGRWLPATALFVVAALSYEVVLPAAAAVVVVVPWWRGQLRFPSAATGLAALAVAGAWMLAHPTYDTGRPVSDLRPAWEAHFGSGVTSVGPAAALLGASVLLAVGVAAWRAARGLASPPDGLVLVGGALVVLGLLPVLKLGLAAVGIADRAYTVSAVGGALLLTGVGAGLARVWRPLALAGAIGGFALVVPEHLSRQDAYHRAGQDVLDLLDHIDLRYGDDLPEVIVVGPTALRRDGVPGTLGVSHARGALRLARGQPDLEMRVAEGHVDYYRQPVSARVHWTHVTGEPMP